MLTEVLYIGDRLRDLRKRALLTQKELADKSGVAQRELQNFRVNLNPQSAHESFGAPKREGEYDDTVYATALACWYRMHHLMEEARYLEPHQDEWLYKDRGAAGA